MTEGAPPQDQSKTQPTAPEQPGPRLLPQDGAALAHLTPQPASQPAPQSAAQPAGEPVPAPAEAAAVPLWRQRKAHLAAGGTAIVAAVAAVALLTGGSQDLDVSFSLYDFAGSSDCEGGSGGYSDLGPGTDVVVRSGDGKVLGTAQLGEGPSVPMSEAVDEDLFDGGCIWSTTVKDVSTGEDFYSVSVGDRGEQTYSSDDLSDTEWSLSLEIGGS